MPQGTYKGGWLYGKSPLRLTPWQRTLLYPDSNAVPRSRYQRFAFITNKVSPMRASIAAESVSRRIRRRRFLVCPLKFSPDLEGATDRGYAINTRMLRVAGMEAGISNSKWPMLITTGAPTVLCYKVGRQAGRGL